MDLHKDFTNMIVEALPGDVRKMLELVGNRACVAGGFCRDIITARNPKDVDVFCADQGAFLEADRRFRSSRYIRTETANAITYKPFLPGDFSPMVQVITRVFIPWHDDLIDTFDFSVCQVAVFYDWGAWRGICTTGFWEDITSSTLHYTAPVRDEDPGGSVIRMLRFVERGYHIGEDDVAAVLGRFFAQLEHPSVVGTPSTAPKHTKRVKAAFRRVGYAGRQAKEGQEECPF